MGMAGRSTDYVPFDKCKCGKPGYRQEKDANRHMLAKRRLTEPSEKMLCPVGDCWHVYNPGVRDKAAYEKFLAETAGEPAKMRPRDPEQLPVAAAAAPTPQPRTATNCTKTGYGTEHIAQLVLAHAQDAGRDEKRAYQCGTCGRWHLTSLDEFFPSDTIVMEEVLSLVHKSGESVALSVGRFPNGQTANVTFCTSRGASCRISAEHLTPLRLVLAALAEPRGDGHA